MLCAKCGKGNLKQSKVCQYCGASLGRCFCNSGRKIIVIFGIIILLAAVYIYALKGTLFKSVDKMHLPGASIATTKSIVPRIVLLVSEQNIEGPQRAWWASEIDLSSTEAEIAKGLINAGYTVLEPSQLTKEIKQSPAFRFVDISNEDSVKLGNLAQVQYVISGKAVASAAGRVPQSNMRSCFANITAKVIRVRDGEVIAYLSASGSSAHMDAITGGNEALVSAVDELAPKLIEAIQKDIKK